MLAAHLLYSSWFGYDATVRSDFRNSKEVHLKIRFLF